MIDSIIKIKKEINIYNINYIKNVEFEYIKNINNFEEININYSDLTINNNNNLVSPYTVMIPKVNHYIKNKLENSTVNILEYLEILFFTHNIYNFNFKIDMNTLNNTNITDVIYFLKKVNYNCYIKDNLNEILLFFEKMFYYITENNATINKYYIFEIIYELQHIDKFIVNSPYLFYDKFKDSIFITDFSIIKEFIDKYIDKNNKQSNNNFILYNLNYWFNSNLKNITKYFNQLTNNNLNEADVKLIINNLDSTILNSKKLIIKVKDITNRPIKKRIFN